MIFCTSENNIFKVYVDKNLKIFIYCNWPWWIYRRHFSIISLIHRTRHDYNINWTVCVSELWKRNKISQLINVVRCRYHIVSRTFVGWFVLKESIGCQIWRCVISPFSQAISLHIFPISDQSKQCPIQESQSILRYIFTYTTQYNCFNPLRMTNCSNRTNADADELNATSHEFVQWKSHQTWKL